MSPVQVSRAAHPKWQAPFLQQSDSQNVDETHKWYGDSFGSFVVTEQLTVLLTRKNVELFYQRCVCKSADSHRLPGQKFVLSAYCFAKSVSQVPGWYWHTLEQNDRNGVNVTLMVWFPRNILPTRAKNKVWWHFPLSKDKQDWRWTPTKPRLL